MYCWWGKEHEYLSSTKTHHPLTLPTKTHHPLTLPTKTYLLLYSIMQKKKTQNISQTQKSLDFFVFCPQKVRNTPSHPSSLFGDLNNRNVLLCRSSKKHKSLVAARCAYNEQPTIFLVILERGHFFWVRFFFSNYFCEIQVTLPEN